MNTVQKPASVSCAKTKSQTCVSTSLLMRILAPMCCAILAVCMTSCKLNCGHYNASSSIQTTSVNGNEKVTVSHRVNGNGFDLESNGKLDLQNGVLNKLREGQYVKILVLEPGHDYHYTLTNQVGAVTLLRKDHAIDAKDELRVKELLKTVEKSAPSACNKDKK